MVDEGVYKIQCENWIEKRWEKEVFIKHMYDFITCHKCFIECYLWPQHHYNSQEDMSSSEIELKAISSNPPIFVCQVNSFGRFLEIIFHEVNIDAKDSNQNKLLP